ncbi:MAG: lipopolysaccharide biosynthesis protein [Oscillospiraceae bacterium]
MMKLKKTISVLFQSNDLSTAQGRENERNRRIALTALTAAVAKVFAMAIPLITVRISLSYLGEEIYGLWMTVTSFFSLFAFADLGLGNGLQTKLSQASSSSNNEGEYRKIISSTYMILLAVAGGAILIFGALFPFLNWSALINAQTQTAISLSGPVVAAIFIPKMLNIPLALVQRTQNALQEGYRANMWQCVGNLLSLLSVYLFSSLDCGAVALIAGSSSIPVVVCLINMIVYYYKQRPTLRPSLRYFEKDMTREMASTGFKFLLLSILTTLGLQIDSFVVARTCSLAEVSTFSILLRVSQLLNIAIQMLGTPLWAASGEALARGDAQWVKKSTRRISRIMTAFTAGCSVLIVLLAPFIFKIWLGQELDYSVWLMIGLLGMQVLFAFVNPYFMVLNGAGIVKKQIAVFLIYTPVALFSNFSLPAGMVWR